MILNSPEHFYFNPDTYEQIGIVGIHFHTKVIPYILRCTPWRTDMLRIELIQIFQTDYQNPATVFSKKDLEEPKLVVTVLQNILDNILNGGKRNGFGNLAKFDESFIIQESFPIDECATIPDDLAETTIELVQLPIPPENQLPLEPIQ